MIGASTALDLLHEECGAALRAEEPEAICADAARATMATHRKAISLKFADSREAVVIHRSRALTMLVLPTPPGFWTWPHEHGMWAVTAMLVGSEDDIVYDRHDHGIVERRRFRIDEGIVASLPIDVVHATGNEGDRVSIGLHIYGGDPRSERCLEWDPDTGHSRPIDADSARRRRTAMARASADPRSTR